VANYYGYDGQGSVRLLTDGTAAAPITDTYDYDAYGVLLAQTGTTQNSYRYAGQQWDAALGMYFNRARYYQPGIGRFWTMDTYEGDQEDPLSLHKYLYCAANPVNMTDPSGHAHLWIKYKDKSTQRIRSANMADLVKVLDNAKTSGNLIDELHIKGHGEKGAVYLVGGGSLSPSTWLGKPGEYFEVRNGRIITGTNDDLTDKFRQAMASGSLIVLSGCETARGKESIAQQMSKVLHNVTVTGGTGLYQWGIPFSSNSIGSKSYFINGTQQLHVFVFSFFNWGF
jgi:RHS repeat-associated protein